MNDWDIIERNTAIASSTVAPTLGRVVLVRHRCWTGQRPGIVVLVDPTQRTADVLTMLHDDLDRDLVGESGRQMLQIDELRVFEPLTHDQVAALHDAGAETLAEYCLPSVRIGGLVAAAVNVPADPVKATNLPASEPAKNEAADPSLTTTT